MTSQIFKINVEREIFFELLDKICCKETKYYMFDLNAYKKGMYDNTIPDFFESIKENYHKSKQKYVDKKITYNAFTTVLRQIIKSHNIPFHSKISYGKSCYVIVYYIYF
jgi:hypothetical protein